MAPKTTSIFSPVLAQSIDKTYGPHCQTKPGRYECDDQEKKSHALELIWVNKYRIL